jgi:hypothetical protein
MMATYFLRQLLELGGGKCQQGGDKILGHGASSH